jgi:cell division protein FtsN
MKKSFFVALFAFAMLPFSSCSNNSEQAAYMQNPTAEANAKEAEQAEEEFAKLASKEETGVKVGKTSTQENKRKPASAVAHSAVAHKEAHHAVEDSSTQKVWTVQLGAFKMKENAEKLTAKLKTDGFPVMMREMNHSKNGELYLVHLEPTPNKTEAEKWQSDLKLKAFDSTLTSRRD